MHNLDESTVWKPCFAVNDVDLPTGYYFGITAATGDLAGMVTLSDTMDPVIYYIHVPLSLCDDIKQDIYKVGILLCGWCYFKKLVSAVLEQTTPCYGGPEVSS